MICKKIDFIDIELEETIKGYLIIYTRYFLISYCFQNFISCHSVSSVIIITIFNKP